MMDRECSTLLEEAALESLAPDIAVRQEGYMQADPEQEVATEADSVAEDTMPSSHQYGEKRSRDSVPTWPTNMPIPRSLSEHWTHFQQPDLGTQRHPGGLTGLPVHQLLL